MNTKLLLRPALGTILFLLVPLVMTFLDQGKPLGEGWRWGLGSVLVMGTLLFSAGLLYEALAQRLSSPRLRAALACGVTLAVLAIWSELAVDAISKSVAALARLL